MSKLLCPHCKKHLARIHPLYGPVWCKSCTKEDDEPREKSAGFHVGVNVPTKGSPEWYKGKWFRRTEKEWHEDIRSRSASPDGKQVIRNGRIN